MIGTNNPDKLSELRSLLRDTGIKVFPLADFSQVPEVREDGNTFEANARKKARLYSKLAKRLTLADDSGLCVSALRGRPGVYSARFAGKGCSYQDNNVKLLRLLKNIPAAKRRAKFVCAIALYDNGKSVGTVKGECSGCIAFGASGKNGFGYDPVFIPDGFSKTFAALPRKTKNQTSHRGKALRKAKKVILAYLKKQ